jgi:hypothetical protein
MSPRSLAVSGRPRCSGASSTFEMLKRGARQRHDVAHEADDDHRKDEDEEIVVEGAEVPEVIEP